MRELSENLWTIEAPHSMAGVEIGARMTIVRLQSGDLWVYAPFEAPSEEIAALEQLGHVAYLVVPSPFHATQAAAFSMRFPEAELWTIPEAHSQLKGQANRTLYEMPDAWKNDFDGERFDSALGLCEWVFCHRASRTLLVTDLCMNLPAPRTPTGTIAKLLFDIGGKFGPSRLERTMIKVNILHRDSAKFQLQTILKWDFDRVIVTHGEVVETGGKAKLQSAFKWLLKAPPVFEAKAKGDHMPGVGA